MIKTPEQKQFYEQATKNILARVNALNLPKDQKQKAVHFVTLFREAFTKEEVKKATFTDKDNQMWDLGYDSGGFCRVASITFVIVMGNISDWQLMAIDREQWEGDMSHHWLKHKPSGKVLDITYDQFAIDGFTVPYNLGQKAAYNLSLQDETHKFAKSIGIDLLKELMRTKDK
nr:hypothetical protein [Candidatus Enterousia merdequi]